MNWRDFCRGGKYAVPVMLGYIPVGFAYGVLAAKAGLSPFAAAMMSLFVYAGSGQFITVSMLTGGAAMGSIILVNFIINLRHLLMSAALSPFLKRWSKPAQAWFCFEMTDETFAMNLNRFTNHGVHQTEAFGLNCFAHMAWFLSGFAGALVGESDLNLDALGLDFAFAGMFIALIIPWLRMRQGLVAASSAGIVSLLLTDFASGNNLHIIIAAVVGATMATLVPAQKEAPHE